MSFVLKVMVQLPDGTKAFLPACKYTDKGFSVAQFNTKQEARNWGEFCLPGETEIHEER